MPENINPKIEIPLALTDKVMELLGILILIAFWAYTLLNLKHLPEVIPTHYRGNGVVDGYGSKWTIISLPIIGTLLYFGLTLVSRYPHKMNHFVTITEANASKQYAIITRMFRVMKIAILLVFFMGAYETVAFSLGFPNVFGKWFMLILFSLIFAPIFYFLIQSSKNA